MTTIILSTEVDLLLKEYIEKNEQKITQSKKTKHKKPSYNDALIYILKRQKAILFYLGEFKKIEGKNKEEHEEIEHLLKQINFCLEK